MIDLNEYKLKYVCRKTEKEFKGKTKCFEEVELIHPDSGEKKTYSIFKLRKEFKTSKKNRSAYIKPEHARPMTRNKKFLSKKFQEYLNEREELSTHY